jgi:hypothetical protein
MDEQVCRICGATVATWELRSASGGGGCTRCEGSPLCSRCGHPRSEHFGVFGGSDRHGCKIKVPARDSLAVSRCGCAGYVAASGPLAQAAFATDDVPLVDTVMPTLRVANPAGTE